MEEVNKMVRLFIKKFKARRKFKKLKWSDDEVWNMTSYCGSLAEAVDLLCYKITNDKRLFPTLKKLIHKKFENNWR